MDIIIVSSIGQYIVNSSGKYYWTLVVDISQWPVVKKLVDNSAQYKVSSSDNLV